jgi:hypothetical protein
MSKSFPRRLFLVLIVGCFLLVGSVKFGTSQTGTSVGETRLGATTWTPAGNPYNFVTNVTVLVSATSQASQLQWSRTYGSYAGYTVIQTVDGGYAIAGSAATYGPHGYYNYTALFIKTNSVGEIQWRKTYSNELGYPALSVMQTEDSGYALSIQGGRLLKLDANGNVQWNKTYGVSLSRFFAIQESDGGFILAGWMPNSLNGMDTFLVKTDQNGFALWNKTFTAGGSSNVLAYALMETNDGGYALTGEWENGYFWLAITDSAGNLLMNRTYNVSNLASYSESLAGTSDGGYILAGGDGARAWLVKVDAEGNMQWNNSYSDEHMNGIFRSVAQTVDGGYIATGLFGNSDSWLVKTDSFGNAEWYKTWNETFPNLIGSKTAFSLKLDKAGGYAIVGELNNTVWLGKFAPESSKLSPSPSPTPAPSPSPTSTPSPSPSPSIPEFPSWIILPLAMTTGLIAMSIIRRRELR